MSTPSLPPQQEAQQAQDSLLSNSTEAVPYDSVWGINQIPEMGPVGTEQFMLAEDKLFVVLAVVMIIWLGIAFFIHRTDTRLKKLEDTLKERSA